MMNVLISLIMILIIYRKFIRPLQRMCAGMLLASAAFFVAGFLEIRLEVMP